MTDREKYLTILDKFYRGRGGSLLTKDESEALDYAISSIKTDLKYDLLYEETKHIADTDKMMESTTKNCRTCRNFGSHNGICEICKDNKCWTEKESTTRNCFGCKYSKDNHNAGTEECHLCMWENQYTPTTKNDLAVDCISRAYLYNRIKQIDHDEDYECDEFGGSRITYHTCDWDEVLREIEDAPSVTPQEPQSFKWCTDCKEYDQEKHCCHRYSKVIRDTVAEIKQEQEPILDKINKMKSEIADSLEFWDYSPNNNPLARDMLETLTNFLGDIGTSEV